MYLMCTYTCKYVRTKLATLMYSRSNPVGERGVNSKHHGIQRSNRLHHLFRVHCLERHYCLPPTHPHTLFISHSHTQAQIHRHAQDNVG